MEVEQRYVEPRYEGPKQPSGIAVPERRPSRRSGFDALRRQATRRRRVENRMMLLSIAGVAVLVALLAHLLTG
jgi:hypothetical protein